MGKKSIVLYFDACACLKPLPAEQRGELFTALVEYAQAAAKGSMEPDPVRERYPAMTLETRMAFSFIADTIRRDTEKWREKHERYRQAAQQRADRTRTPGKRIQGNRENAWKYMGE